MNGRNAVIEVPAARWPAPALDGDGKAPRVVWFSVNFSEVNPVARCGAALPLALAHPCRLDEDDDCDSDGTGYAVGGLATAQRNTAASMLIAAGSFSDSEVFVLITLLNTLGPVLLIVIAKGLRRDNAKVILI